MTCLLALPVELRYDIIERVLLNCEPPPSSVESASAGRYKSNSQLCVHGPNYVRFSGAPVVPNSLGLLLANRQLSLETSTTITRLRASQRLTYVLDVILVNDSVLWPTWLCVPATVTVVDSVHVTFRAFGARSRGGGSAYFANASAQLIMYGFYFLLEHFLVVSPGGNVSMRSLVLDFSDDGAPEDGARKHEWLSMHRKYGHSIPGDVVPIAPRASWLADTVAGYIRGILSMDYYTSHYGAILYKRIGSLTVQENGKELRHFDLGALIAPLAFDDPTKTFGNRYPHEVRLPAFWDWKEAAVRARLDCGLPVGAPVVARPASVPREAELHVSAFRT
ncbi:hypothetical protein EXIGLDRAFT_716460 [Exidia glandulosa HHB12029]|uniref:Uncharacterized protein n=1 Tax=Exidia glandulosa HHB12029 TaxID=1314781 RepID=A0A165P8W6_EXIGL|nr:hypothetical protein EXIGLDRAFT_716460 [Exidia glandulosa HHB12029]